VRNVRKGYYFEEAINHWTQSTKRRVDEKARVELGIHLPRSCHIVLDDVCSLNEKDDDRDAPDSFKHDQLRVGLVPLVASSPQALKKSNFSAAGPPRSSRKRKCNTAEQLVASVSGDGEVKENDGWRASGDGKGMVKRVGSSL
jgi:hypothetical protein